MTSASASPALTFLGTGAAGGTPGTGRSRRRESSALATAGAVTVLIDVTRDLPTQLDRIERIDGIVLTHGHADAIGGFATLGRWWRRRTTTPIPTYASAATIDAVRRRFRRLQHVAFVATAPDERRRIGPWDLVAVEVPHARDPVRFPTYAWRLTASGRSVTYASDVARPTHALAASSAGSTLLAIDGATYRRAISSHLRIDRDLPTICRWDVRRIALTQIGRSAPPHDRLVRIAADLCPKAFPAYDGLEVAL